MLSMILYGRNDAHGYNLHKRGALSLNALAQVMRDPSDELIFVDYNTPDELPTFPEAIADTLTDRCKARLRILRVRPSYHAQFAGKTRLVALEPHSRNIAIRRTNPDNRWILSTNTDMVFCTARSDDDLSAVVGGLDDGFYHLPRFEVPEGFWERLDRKDPQAAIAAMRESGTRFHINEIVYGSYDNLYEGPGDFQLFLRQDLFDIRGFDERMILGWHADSNMARRMKLLRGEVKTAFPLLHGYHCGHTRQATSLHGGSRTQNNSDVFVRDMVDPVAPDQDLTWGAPDIDIEEVRLDRDDHYFHAMSAAVKTEGPAYTEAAYNDGSLYKVTYDADHVMPHLCDILFNLPAGQTIFFFGDDVRILEGARTFLEEAGREPRFVLTDLAGCPALGPLDESWKGSVLPLPQAIAEADLFLIQYPAGDGDEGRLEEREWSHHRLLSSISAAERRKPKSERRRIVVVNGIHNGIAMLVESSLAPSVMPFSSRLRQGFVVDDAVVGGQDIAASTEWPIYQRLGRRTPFLPADIEILKRVVDGLRRGRPIKGWERLAPEIAAICAAPTSARLPLGVSDEEAEEWALRADNAMRHTIGRLVEQPSVVGPRAEIGNRLCSGDDWNDPDWLRLAMAYFGPDVVSLSERKRWMWERVSLADIIQRHMPLTYGMTETSLKKRLLLVGDTTELLAAILVHMGYDVTCASSEELIAGKAAGHWRKQLDLSWLKLPPAFHMLDSSRFAGPFDGFVVTKPSLFEKSHAEAEAILKAADPMMAPGALLFCAATVQINEEAYEGGFSFAEWKSLYDPEGPLGARGFQAVGGVDTRVPLDAAARFALQDDPQDTVYGLSYGYVNSYNTSVLLTARWPDTLAVGPSDRVRWGGAAIDTALTPIPYSGVLTHQDSAAADRKPSRIGGDDLASRAFRAIEILPAKINERARNVLPFAITEGQGQVSPTSLYLPVEDAEDSVGPWFALCLDAGDAASAVVNIQGVGEPAFSEGTALVHGVGPLDVSLSGGRAVVRREGGLGRISMVLRLSGGEARLSRIDAFTEKPS
jgi:hypothetical protein